MANTIQAVRKSCAAHLSMHVAHPYRMLSPMPSRPLFFLVPQTKSKDMSLSRLHQDAEYRQFSHLEKDSGLARATTGPSTSLPRRRSAGARQDRDDVRALCRGDATSDFGVDQSVFLQSGSIQGRISGSYSSVFGGQK